MDQQTIDTLFKNSLAGKTAVVTAGGGVLCATMATALAQCNVKVAILDVSEELAKNKANEINSNGGHAIAIAVDALNKKDLERAEKIVSEKLGPCDILINGVGGNHPKGITANEFLNKEDIDNSSDRITFYDLKPNDMEFIFNLNFFSTFLSSQVFSKNMAKNGHGCIINISSMSAFCPLTKVPIYSAAKAAVSNFTQWLSVHLSKVGIRVNAIAPGFFLTQQNRSLLTNADGTYTERANKILSRTPAGRFGTPEDLLGTLLWLVNDQTSGFVTGITVPIDGGFLAYSGI